MAQMLAEQQGSGPNPVDETGLCLLSLDGGGVRGLSTLYILRNLMARLAYERYGDAVNKYPPVKPCEVFDLIGGTSTGGLIAIMLGRLEMTVDECIIAYRELIKDVFKARESRAGISAFGRVTSRFSSKALEIAIKRVLASREGVSEDDLFDDGKARGCRVFVCTVAKETRDISRLKSYTIPGESESLVRPTIWEAALATSAATRFFDPVKIGARSFIDGAMGANNPVDQVQNEAIQIWCPESADLKPLVKCFISVGTGNPGKKPIRDNAWKLLSETLVDIVTDTEKTAEMFDGRWIGDSTADRYFRFNVEQGLQDIGLEEYQKEGAIEAATFGYFKATRKSIEVKRCAKNLVRKQKKTPREFKSLFTVTSRTSTKKPHWVVHFEQNLKFVARDTQLNQLDKLLFANGHCPKVALVGLGGVGKTQIAIQLAYWIRVKYAELSVYWISATDMESLEQAYQKIGEKLEIPGLDEKQSNVKDLVRQRLSEGTTGPWLLIFDNADDPDMWSRKPHNTAKACCLQGYLPKSNTGRILFTTRSRKIACELARHNIVEVPEMDDQAAVGLLQRSLPNRTIEVDDPTVLQLLKELTYLPLAITQAAAFMNMYGASCSDYLKLLQEEKEEDVIAILSEDFEDEGRYSTTVNPVATTWLISFEQIKRHNPAAAEYMSFMSCLGAKNIPISLLPPAPSRKQMIEAVGTLSGYSFVTKRTDEALDIHRLVHLAMRNWLRTNGLLAECTTRAVTRVCEVFPSNDPKYRVMWRLYLPHAQHILVEAAMASVLDQDSVELMHAVGYCLSADGRTPEAERLFVQALEATKKRCGDRDPETLTSMESLASAFSNNGQLEKAEKLQRQIIEIMKEEVGEAHSDTLTSMANLALTYSDQERWPEAEELQMQVIEAMKKELGERNPETLHNISSLASMYYGQGRLEEAEQLQLQVIKVMKQELGERAHATLSSMETLALWYYSHDRSEKAEQLEVQVVEARRKELTDKHPDTVDSMAYLALTYYDQGRWRDAEQLQVQVVEEKTKELGNRDPETVKAMQNLALTYYQQGRWTEAKQLEQQME